MCVFQYALANKTQEGLEWNGRDLLPVSFDYEI
jgi:hypothetical protein